MQLFAFWSNFFLKTETKARSRSALTAAVVDQSASVCARDQETMQHTHRLIHRRRQVPSLCKNNTPSNAYITSPSH
jgi:hypothetical protein